MVDKLNRSEFEVASTNDDSEHSKVDCAIVSRSPFAAANSWKLQAIKEPDRHAYQTKL